MIQLVDLFQIFADAFLGGNTLLAGLIVLVAVLAITLSMTRSVFVMLLVAMPTTLVFSYMRVIPDEITIILLVVSIVGLAYSARGVFK